MNSSLSVWCRSTSDTFSAYMDVALNYFFGLVDLAIVLSNRVSDVYCRLRDDAWVVAHMMKNKNIN